VKVGDFVTNNWHGIIRYGKVKKVLNNPKGDNWTYFIVNWIDDEQYQKAAKHINKISNRKYEPEYYRADQIRSFNVSKALKTLKKLQNNAE
jgi:hypothetical protein